MSNINLVIVPVWLNLIQKELGIEDGDLANIDKLCGILSPRDLLIYKMVNAQAVEVFKLLGEKPRNSADHSCNSFSHPLPTPTLEERAAMANVPLETLVYGATAHRDEGFRLLADVQLVDTELVVVRCMQSDKAPDIVRECTDSLATKITKVLHGRIPLNELAMHSAFKQYVADVQINPVFY